MLFQNKSIVFLLDSLDKPECIASQIHKFQKKFWVNQHKMEIGEPAAIKAWAEGRTICIELTDSRIIGFPADRFKILSKATDHQLKEVKIRLDGFALRWESIDEDITVPGIVAGNFQLPCQMAS